MASRERKNKKITEQKFTIVLSNYNNEEYIEEALISVFHQTYSNIELIITDDASENFNKKRIEKIINEYSQDNISDIKFLINNENLGTVKTLNKALNLVSGEYILFFSSDDKLENKDVIKNYANVFKDKNVNVITSNWIICDEKLKTLRKYQKTNFLESFNKKKVKNQYAQLCRANIYGAGSTCYRKIVFDKYGNFDENFKYLEDWPLWIKLTFNNEKIYYLNIDGLLHRSGGISNDKNVNATKLVFFKEVLNLYKNNILNNIRHLTYKSRIQVINSYLYSIISYSKYIDTKEYYDNLINYINSDKKVKICYLLYKCSPNFYNKFITLFYHNNVVLISFFITIFLVFSIINIFKISNKLYFILMITLLYIIVYYLACTILTFLSTRRNKAI